jgi:hypothetical protein
MVSCALSYYKKHIIILPPDFHCCYTNCKLVTLHGVVRQDSHLNLVNVNTGHVALHVNYVATLEL